jgi:hypothetical protein
MVKSGAKKGERRKSRATTRAVNPVRPLLVPEVRPHGKPDKSSLRVAERHDEDDHHAREGGGAEAPETSSFIRMGETSGGRLTKCSGTGVTFDTMERTVGDNAVDDRTLDLCHEEEPERYRLSERAAHLENAQKRERHAGDEDRAGRRQPL